MELSLRVFTLILSCAYTIHAMEADHTERTFFIGGRFLLKGVSAEYCIRYCRKLGYCWGVDYFRYDGRCSVHLDESICDPDRGRHFDGVDHFRVKECREEVISPEARPEEEEPDRSLPPPYGFSHRDRHDKQNRAAPGFIRDFHLGDLHRDDKQMEGTQHLVHALRDRRQQYDMQGRKQPDEEVQPIGRHQEHRNLGNQPVNRHNIDRNIGNQPENRQVGLSNQPDDAQDDQGDIGSQQEEMHSEQPENRHNEHTNVSNQSEDRQDQHRNVVNQPKDRHNEHINDEHINQNDRNPEHQNDEDFRPMHSHAEQQNDNTESVNRQEEHMNYADGHQPDDRHYEERNGAGNVARQIESGMDKDPHLMDGSHAYGNDDPDGRDQEERNNEGIQPNDGQIEPRKDGDQLHVDRQQEHMSEEIQQNDGHIEHREENDEQHVGRTQKKMNKDIQPNNIEFRKDKDEQRMHMEPEHNNENIQPNDRHIEQRKDAALPQVERQHEHVNENIEYRKDENEQQMDRQHENMNEDIQPNNRPIDDRKDERDQGVAGQPEDRIEDIQHNQRLHDRGHERTNEDVNQEERHPDEKPGENVHNLDKHHEQRPSEDGQPLVELSERRNVHDQLDERQNNKNEEDIHSIHMHEEHRNDENIQPDNWNQDPMVGGDNPEQWHPEHRNRDEPVGRYDVQNDYDDVQSNGRYNEHRYDEDDQATENPQVPRDVHIHPFGRSHEHKNDGSSEQLNWQPEQQRNDEDIWQENIEQEQRFGEHYDDYMDPLAHYNEGGDDGDNEPVNVDGVVEPAARQAESRNGEIFQPVYGHHEMMDDEFIEQVDRNHEQYDDYIEPETHNNGHRDDGDNEPVSRHNGHRDGNIDVFNSNHEHEDDERRNHKNDQPLDAHDEYRVDEHGENDENIGPMDRQHDDRNYKEYHPLDMKNEDPDNKESHGHRGLGFPEVHQYEQDIQVKELRARLDAKTFTTDCFMHIYESSFAQGGFYVGRNMTLTKCADKCLAHPHCVSLNYKRKDGKCYFFSKVYNVNNLASSTCCHHVSVSCYKEHSESERGSSSPSSSSSYHRTSVTTSPGPSTYPPPTTLNRYPHTTHYPPPPMDTPSPSLTTRRPPPPVHRPDSGTIPGVCPFLVLPGTSRRGGRIEEDMQGISNVTECMKYCKRMNIPGEIVRCCAGDWNNETKDCFVFETCQDETDMLNYTDPYITHFQYNPCESIPEMQCVVHGPVDMSQNTVVIGQLGANISHTVEPCDTYCYYKYSFTVLEDPAGNTVQTLERGCGADMGDYLRWRQCASPPATRNHVSTTCHCRGSTCNALGYSALFNSFASFAMDFNMNDQSGYRQHGVEVGTVKYSVFDKRSLHAAAVFDGRSYVKVPGMTLIHFSQVLFNGKLKVALAVSLWMKRIPNKDGSMTIVSNAEQRGHSSIEIYSDQFNKTHHVISASITLGKENFIASSHPVYIGAWQFVCVNIGDDVTSPVMKLYIGDEALGQVAPELVRTITLPTKPTHVDLSPKALTIGKHQGPGMHSPFIGLLDELRFFQGKLTEDDIKALMLHYNYYR